MKKYVFLVKKAVKNEVEIEAENRKEAFKKLVKIFEENEEKVFKNSEETEIVRMRLERIIDTEKGKILDRLDFNDEELLEILHELDEENTGIFPREFKEIVCEKCGNCIPV